MENMPTELKASLAKLQQQLRERQKLVQIPTRFYQRLRFVAEKRKVENWIFTNQSAQIDFQKLMETFLYKCDNNTFS